MAIQITKATEPQASPDVTKPDTRTEAEKQLMAQIAAKQVELANLQQELAVSAVRDGILRATCDAYRKALDAAKVEASALRPLVIYWDAEQKLKRCRFLSAEEAIVSSKRKSGGGKSSGKSIATTTKVADATVDNPLTWVGDEQVAIGENTIAITKGTEFASAAEIARHFKLYQADKSINYRPVIGRYPQIVAGLVPKSTLAPVAEPAK